jgi:hypothetical protein
VDGDASITIQHVTLPAVIVGRAPPECSRGQSAMVRIYADIAASLQVGHKTVKNQVNRIFAKLGARSRVEAVLIWQGGTPAPGG